MKRNRIGTALALALAGMLALPLSAAAEETKVLYKCVNAKGVVAIQSKPCPAGSTEAWKRASESEPKPTQADIAAAQAREARNRQQVSELATEVQRRVDEQTPPPRVDPPQGSHLAGATNPVEGSQLAPKKPLEAEDVPLPQSVSIDGCQSAQGFAASVREKTWIGLTDDQLRRIFGWVADQCRVKTEK
jgi:hypothetical protein